MPITLTLEAIKNRDAVVARFWSHVEKTEGCWLWTKGTDDDGYGLIQIQMTRGGGRGLRVHRLSYMLHHGPIPPGLIVLHSCDTPACCRPDHLSVGTHQRNRAECMARGRWQGRPRLGENAKRPTYLKTTCWPGNTSTRGEDRPAAKLTDKDVQEIRRRYAARESSRALARDYGVSKTTITNVANRILWRHIP